MYCCIFILFTVYILNPFQVLAQSTKFLSSFNHKTNLVYAEVFSNKYSASTQPSNRKTFKNENIGKRFISNQYGSSNISLIKNVYKGGFVVKNRQKCLKKGKNIKLIIIIQSNPSNDLARKSIRETWGQFGHRKDIKVIFLLGTTTDSWIEEQLKDEQKNFDDIVRGNFLDTQINTNLKIISTLEWIDKYCPRAKFILKVHDNVFINIPQFLIFSKTHMHYENTIFSRFYNNSSHNLLSKNNSSFIDSEISTYSADLSERIYLLTNDTIHKLFQKARQKEATERKDTLITEGFTEDLKIKRVHIDNFMCNYEITNACDLQNCFCLNNLKPHQQNDLWIKLFTCNSDCPKFRCYKSSDQVVLPCKTIVFISITSLCTMNLYKKYTFCD